MKLLFDSLPILIFFIAYKFSDIYTATISVIVLTLLQVGFYWLKYRRIDRMLMLTAVLALLLGSITLLLHDEIYIKWKPTVIYWLLSVIFIGSQYISGKSIIERMLEGNLKLPKLVWNRLNLSWALFFFVMGVSNLFVVYHYSTDVWVNFKLIGILGLTLIFIILQSLYLARYIQPDRETNSSSAGKKEN